MLWGEAAHHRSFEIIYQSEKVSWRSIFHAVVEVSLIIIMDSEILAKKATLCCSVFASKISISSLRDIEYFEKLVVNTP